MIKKLTFAGIAALVGLTMPMTKVEGQIKEVTSADPTIFSSNPIPASPEDGDLYHRSVNLYPSEVLSDAEEGDQVVQLTLQRFTDAGEGIFPMELEGDNNLRIYAKMQPDEQLSSQVNWNNQTDDAELIFDGSVEEIVGAQAGPKEFRLNEGPFEWGDEDDNFQLMFEFQLDEAQEHGILWVNSDADGVEDYDEQQAFSTTTAGGFADEIEEQEDGIRPFFQLTIAEEPALIDAHEGLGFSKEIFPIEASTVNGGFFTVGNFGYSEAELTLEIEEDDFINHSWDTTFTLEHFQDEVISTPLPIANEEGTAQYEVTLRDLDSGDELLSTTGQQQFSNTTSAYVSNQMPDGGIDYQNITDLHFLNFKDFNEDVLIESVEIFIPDNSIIEGNQVIPRIYDQDMELDLNGTPILAESDDLGSMVELEFDNPYEYEEEDGVIFIGAFIEEAGNVEAPYANSFNASNTSFIYTEVNGQEVFQSTPSTQQDFLLRAHFEVQRDYDITLLEPEEEECPSEEQEVMVELENNSGSDISDFDVSAEIVGENETVTISENIPGTLEDEATTEIPVGTFSSEETGDANFIFSVNDEEVTEVSREFTLPEAGFSVDHDGFDVTFEAENTDLDNYLWEFGDGNEEEGGASTTHTYDEEGNFDVTLTIDPDGDCENSSSQEITVDESTFISAEDDESADFNLFPNPAEEYLNIELFAEDKGDVKVSIVGLSGKEQYKETFEVAASGNKEVTLNLEEADIATGTYLLQVSQGRAQSSELFIVK